MYDATLVRALTEGITPRSVLSFPDWADRHIVLRREGRKVPWRTELTPYLREPMMRLSVDDPAEEIVIMKPSQVGASEMLNAYCAYRIAVVPASILFLQPDIEAAKRYSQARLAPLFEDCEALRGLLAEVKARDSGNTINSKQYWGGTLDILGGNSPAGLASAPKPVVLIDEWDRMAAGAGLGGRAEGDQYELAKNRMITFLRRKMLATSTPGDLTTSRIEPAWLASDRRQFYLECPMCSALIVLDFKRLWCPGDDLSRTVYTCQRCDRGIDERHKRDMLAGGKWVAEEPARSVLGYRFNGLYSPWLRWAQIMDRWIKARGKPNKLRVFTNNIKGETYDVHGETRVQHHRLAVLREVLPVVDGFVVVPRQVRVLTAGGDVQHNRIEVCLYGWGPGEECWHLERRVIYGDPSGDQIWEDLDAYLLSTWTTESGASMRIKAAGIDTGYEAHRVYEFVRTRGARAVWGVKGSKGGEGRKVWPKKPSVSSYRKTEFYLVGQDTAKGHIYARLKASCEARDAGVLGGTGHVHIAAHIGDDEYLEGLVSEVPETKTIHGHPRIIWVLPEHKRNEPLDCAVYGYAALHGWKAKGRRLERPTDLPPDISSRPEKLHKREEIGSPLPVERVTVARERVPEPVNDGSNKRPRWG